ncbi:MAG TPA: AAA family ATPase [Caulobacteraceae bacterium]|nr:AAA family ATPase [Caulobacteraceae bacterium]
MKRYILTGAPGAGKTVLLRRLELAGYPVVEEAATDLIALTTAQGVERHWDGASAIDDLVALQRARQLRADSWSDPVVVFDRSPICTWALVEFLGRTPSPGLIAEVERLQAERTYERRVLFCDLLGFITPTEARRITLEDSRRFEAVHAEVYARFSYELVHLPPADVETRFATARAVLAG